VKDDKCGGKLSHFRGRELKGTVVDIPNDVHGLCVADTSGGRWTVEGKFSKIHVWEHDIKPDPSVVNDCIAWLSVAKSVSLVQVHL
jgi:hypothetical protein